MLTYDMQAKHFRTAEIQVNCKDDLDMLEIICQAVINDKVTSTSQLAAKELLRIVQHINKEQDD